MNSVEHTRTHAHTHNQAHSLAHAKHLRIFTSCIQTQASTQFRSYKHTHTHTHASRVGSRTLREHLHLRNGQVQGVLPLQAHVCPLHWCGQYNGGLPLGVRLHTGGGTVQPPAVRCRRQCLCQCGVGSRSVGDDEPTREYVPCGWRRVLGGVHPAHTFIHARTCKHTLTPTNATSTAAQYSTPGQSKSTGPLCADKGARMNVCVCVRASVCV